MMLLRALVLLHTPLLHAHRVIRAANLWSRADALGLLHHEVTVSFGTGTLPAPALAQARRDSVELLDALAVCVGPACAAMAAAPAATEASKISPWSSEGRARRQAAAAAAAAASELQALVEAERRALAADSSALASPAALRLAQHLRAATGSLPMLGATVPLCRSAAFAAAALIASGLATDEGLGAARGRWGALAEASEVAFDAAREVLDAALGVAAVAAATAAVMVVVAHSTTTTTVLLLLPPLLRRSMRASSRSRSAGRSRTSSEATATPTPHTSPHHPYPTLTHPPTSHPAFSDVGCSVALP